MSIVLLTFLTVVLSAVAQLTLKMGMNAPSIQALVRSGAGIREILFVAGTNLNVILGLLLYGLSAVIWLLVLARWDLSKAYPFVGVGFVITMLFGIGVLGERLTLDRVLGTFLVVGGVLLVSRS